MRKVSEYQEHADECRRMAARMKDATHKTQLEEMARAWTMLAEERKKQLEKQGGRRPDPAGATAASGMPDARTAPLTPR